jgi:hypothetical protein
MTFKAANIEQATPAKRGSRAGDFAGDLAALGLHLGEHGFDGLPVGGMGWKDKKD